MRCALVAFIASIALVATGCGSEGRGDTSPRGVVELTSIDTLRQAFDDDVGSARLLLLLSPT